MAWYSKALGMITGLFSGGGGIVSAVDDGFKLADDVTKEVHDKNQRDSGAIAQREKDDFNELQAIRDGNSAAADPAAIKRVRDEYQIDRPT